MAKEIISFKIGVILLMVYLGQGCATAPLYEEIWQEKEGYNYREYPFSYNEVREAILGVLVSKNFLIDKEDELILARRSFQKGSRTILLVVQAKILSEGKKSKLYLTALESKERLYVADRTRFFMFIVPLPGGGGKEAERVKEGEKIITDKRFYERMFSAVDKQLQKLKNKGQGSMATK